MELRRWQAEAAQSALKTFRTGHSHFLCLATPGAGKTLMAATVANELIMANEIELVFCFAPSINVATSFRHALENSLSTRLDGLLGSQGKVVTYQAMLNLPDSFWNLLATHRTLIIFDEIHHCGGDSLDNANVWGQKIITEIQGKATYTMALTGTPWRSDCIPITLSSYCQKGRIHCDYNYGLQKAITDGVCRTPKITAIDNEYIVIKTPKGEKHFKSFSSLLKSYACSYQQLIENTSLIHYMLSLSTQQLDYVKAQDEDAGGLIIAASVEHAIRIADILLGQFGEEPSIVTYQHDNAQNVIQRFRHSQEKWIISVGMISEGTDIPRLRVCCYLTRIKTELSFRQVLGRILRVRKSTSEDGFLFMPAEPNLMTYANRIALDIPKSQTVFVSQMNTEVTLADDISQRDDPLIKHNEKAELSFSEENDTSSNLIAPIEKPISDKIRASNSRSLCETYEASIGLFGRFKKQLIYNSKVDFNVR